MIQCLSFVSGSISVPGKDVFYSTVSSTCSNLPELNISCKLLINCLYCISLHTVKLPLVSLSQWYWLWWRKMISAPQQHFSLTLTSHSCRPQRSERLCWSSAGTVSMWLGWRWGAGARGTSSNLLNMQENKTRLRWGEIKHELWGVLMFVSPTLFKVSQQFLYETFIVPKGWVIMTYWFISDIYSSGDFGEASGFSSCTTSRSTFTLYLHWYFDQHLSLFSCILWENN